MLALIGTVVTIVGRLLVGLILCIAGVAKIRRGQSRFLKAILGYDLVPRGAAIVLSRWLPWIEVLTGILLLVGFLSRLAVVIAFGLLLLFSTAIVISLLNRRDNDCGCLGSLTPVQWRLVYRNLLLMGILLPIYVYGVNTISIDTWIGLTYPPFMNRASLFLVVLWGAMLLGAMSLHWLIRLQIAKLGESQS